METPPQRQTTSPLLLHISKASERLGLSQYQTRALIADGSLPSTTIGNRTYIAAAAIDEYAAKIGQAS